LGILTTKTVCWLDGKVDLVAILENEEGLGMSVPPNLVPRVSLFKMAAAREKTLAHSRSRVSNEDGDIFKMAAAAKRVRRTGYEMLR